MVISKSSCTAGIFVLLALLPGCSELRGRRHAREGNRLFEAGNYEQAVAEYDEAERLRPGLPQVALNKGLACRQLLGPGVPRPETERAASCALAAFQHLKELRPNDSRADQLYVQTLFDADRYETLATMYQKQLAERPNDRAALDGLVQVYSRWDRWEDALRWIIKRADSDPSDAAAQYSVGAFVWDVLFRKGGSAEKNQFDPRAGAADGGVAAPLFGINDIVGQRRVQLAETGIAYLQKALQLRAGYREALTYLNLLYRQKSFAYFNDPAAWQAAVDKAESYRKQAVEQATAAPGASR